MRRTELKRSTPLRSSGRPKPTRKAAKKAPSAAALRKKATMLWGRYIHLRDKVCQVCSGGQGKLDAHHILRREFNATRTDENNGMLVHAYPCHQTVLHGDPFQAVQIYTYRLGVEGYAALRQKAYDGINGRYGVDYWRNEAARLTGLIEELEGNQ